MQTVRIFTIGMEFGISKCAMIRMKKGEKVSSDQDRTIPKGEKVRSLQEEEEKEEGYRYLRVLESAKVKNQEMKTVRNEYLRRIRKILKARLNAGK